MNHLQKRFLAITQQSEAVVNALAKRKNGLDSTLASIAIHASKAQHKAQDADGEKWITVNGTHIKVDENGQATTGPKELKKDLNKKENSSSQKGESQKAENKVHESRPAQPAPSKKVSSAHFVPALDAAKATCPPQDAWRVDTYRKPEDFDKENITLYQTEGGSTFAIKPDGDIISVCKNKKTDTVNGKDIMAAAVQAGGTHLDSFAGNYGFYTKCGFEVVSRCKFDTSYDIPGWDSTRDKQEDIYFMRYVGVGKVQDADEQSMRKRVPYSSDYGAAEEVLKAQLKKGE